MPSSEQSKLASVTSSLTAVDEKNSMTGSVPCHTKPHSFLVTRRRVRLRREAVRMTDHRGPVAWRTGISDRIQHRACQTAHLFQNLCAIEAGFLQGANAERDGSSTRSASLLGGVYEYTGLVA